MMTFKILMVLTSHSDLGDTGEKTGFWVEEFAAPYYIFKDAGAQITLASPLGGQPPVDPKSELEDFQTAATKRFDADNEVQQLIANTETLSAVNADDFDAVFYPGGHGPLWDLTNNADSINLLQNFIAQLKPVSAVCHATAALLNVKDTNGQLFIKNKEITGFSNSEEDAVQLREVVPFMLEDEIVKRNALYQSGADWHPFVIQDGLAITGQNPASSELVAQKLLALLAE
jgi:putative intracellular protease/amidase